MGNQCQVEGGSRVLRRWTKDPIEDFNHFIPVWEEEEEEDGLGCVNDKEEADEEVDSNDWFNTDQAEVDFDLGFNFDGLDGVDQGEGDGVEVDLGFNIDD